MLTATTTSITDIDLLVLKEHLPFILRTPTEISIATEGSENSMYIIV